MTWIAYTVGALGAAATTGAWDFWIYVFGFWFLFFLEAATVFTNEWFDFDTDRINEDYGPFNGGSRVLVDENLSHRQMAAGIGTALCLTAGSMVLLLTQAGFSLPILTIMGIMTVLALGYTIPPLKLSWRGLGELDVGFTHSLGAVLCGYLFLGGHWMSPFPWLVSIPLFLSVLPSIILAGIPDYSADKKAGKKTLAVLLGKKRAKQAALLFTLLAVVSVAILQGRPVLMGTLDGLFIPATLHGMFLIYKLYKDQKGEQKEGRIDGLMALSLSFIFWFGIIPLIHLF